MLNEQVCGYKVFNFNWKCKDKQYSCPGEFYEEVEPELCQQGMHYCTDIHDCFTYHFINVPNDFENKSFHFAKVVPLGKIDTNNFDSKCCTNRLLIMYEIYLLDIIDLIDPNRFLEKAKQFNDMDTVQGYNTADYYLSLYKYFSLCKCRKAQIFKKFRINHFKLEKV